MSQAIPDCPGGPHRVICHLDRMLAAQDMTLAELALKAGVTVANLSVLKNNRARAVRFTTLTAVCDVLRCQPGDLFTVRSTSDPPAKNPPAYGDTSGA